jgi:hypothetical protein
MNENSETLSFKRIYISAKALFAFLLRKWLIIVAAGVIGGVLGISYAYFSKPDYTAELNFVLSDGNPQSNFAGLASQFGIDLSTTGTDVFSQDNAMFLMTSRKMLGRALFRTLPNSNKLLINVYAQQEKMDTKWNKDPYLKSSYPFPADQNKMTPVQDSLFREIYTDIKKKNFDVSQPDKKMNVFRVATTYQNEAFTCYLTKYLVEETSAFYIETKTSIARQNLNMLQHEADSLRARLGGNIVETAAAVDRTLNLNPAYQVGRVPIQKSQVDAAVTQAAYTEVVKNLEIARITLAKAFPIYQIIDEPTLPLRQEKMGRLLGAVIFGTVAALLVIIFFMAKYYVAKELKSSSYE